MRKGGFLASSVEMPNELNCSSIRMNDEEEVKVNPRNQRQLAAPKTMAFKQFE
jgi:hypothetical protein